MRARKWFAAVLVLSLVLVQSAATFGVSAAPGVTASPQKIIIDGREVTVEAYNIDGHVYVRLRDIAQVLNGTRSQFSVDYDPRTRTVTAITGQPYQAVGGELSLGPDMSDSCSPSPWTLRVNGLDIGARRYLVGDRNFFRLRDLGNAFGFAVDCNRDAGAFVLTTGKVSLVLNMNAYVQKDGYRAYENVVYVTNPVDTTRQVMNIYVPDGYFRGETINGYTADTAPIFFYNKGGGFTGQSLVHPADYENGYKYLTDALKQGYVVVSANCRGHKDCYIDVDGDGQNEYTGKAPAQIVDVKSAIRYLRYNDPILPGTAEKIVITGGSSGGNLSALAGTSGNNPYFEPYFEQYDAADARDDVFAVGDYFGPTDFGIADVAYEWSFNRDKAYASDFVTRYIKGRLGMTEEAYTARVLGYLEAAYAKYLKSTSEQPVSFYDPETGKIDFDGFRASINENTAGVFDRTKINWKPVPSFDNDDISKGGSYENSLFGNEETAAVHFTDAGFARAGQQPDEAVKAMVQVMNPTHYIGDSDSDCAQHWWLRHGTRDGDIPYTMTIDLAHFLMDAGIKDVSFEFAWGYGHGKIEDSPENQPAFFAWIDSICRR